MNSTIKFCKLELILVSNFTLNKEFQIFGTNLPKKGISSQKNTKKLSSTLNSAYLN